MILSKNFTLEEMEYSPTALRKGIDNSANNISIIHLKDLCENVLQPLRDWYDNPIKINSGYRSKELNSSIGGSLSSQHCTGQAADIDTLNDNADLFFHIKRHMQFDQLIWEFGDHTNPSWVHVSFKKHGNRNHVLRAYKEDGKTKYIQMT